MTMMQLFGKHEVSYVTELPDGKVSIGLAHYDTPTRNVATDVDTSLFFDDMDGVTRFALALLSKVVQTMGERTVAGIYGTKPGEVHDVETR